MALDLHKFVMVQNRCDNIPDVVGNPGIGGYHAVQFDVGTVRVVGAGDRGGHLTITLRHKGEDFFHPVKCRLIGILGEMGHAALGVVGHGAPQRFGGDFLAGDGFNDLGTGDEHVAGFFDHDGEIRDGG